MMFSFTAAAIQCAFVDIAADLDVSVHETTYLVALFIAVTGSSPLFWGPMSNTFGRRPIFLISLACTLAGNVACALSPSYLAMAGCRAITAFFVSPAASLGSAVVSEIFFKKNRGRYMGVWTVMITLGIPTAPLVFGFVAFRVGYRWIYWILAITNSVQFLLHFFLGSETRYDPTTAPTSPPTLVQRYFGFRRINPKPIRPFDFVRPLTFVTRKCVIMAASSHAMVFLWCTVMTTLEIPQIFPKKFGLNAQEVGLQNIGNIVGTLVGEQVGGFCSDKWMLLPQGRGKAAKPEFRLWLSYMGGYILAIVGVVIFLLQIDNATNQWNVTPLVGAGIAAAGNQIVTTVMVTYAVDCYPKDAAAIGGLVNFVRQTWGFIGPFWFPLMIEKLGLTRSTAVPIATMVGVSVIPTMLLQWKGRTWNKEHESLADSRWKHKA
ncbi:major facilitator superfamily transporter multidrug resistance [Ophiocordyceps sinensis CO18]|uniref:Major facilitator superfamily transporter multidrug resistance n=1 Tax=Ophiocordyceps sinensis (strain Co18 / CGMCC 3.14243) TaxID=911162 RepID=T5AGC3_OPHSC|nr:major facilitator superfamily transporter multidrug resistance [Ophiocordyceps sinensis CO18]